MLVALIGVALYSYFIGTQTFLERAEAFKFRRMTVPQLAEQGHPGTDKGDVCQLEFGCGHRCSQVIP